MSLVQIFWYILFKDPINRDTSIITSLQFWNIFPKYIKLIISQAFYSPTDFTNHKLPSNVPGLVLNLWELAVRGLLFAL